MQDVVTTGVTLDATRRRGCKRMNFLIYWCKIETFDRLLWRPLGL